MARRALIRISLISIAITWTAISQSTFAQLLGELIDVRSCSVAATADVTDSTVTLVCGMPQEKVIELVRLSASSEAGDRAQLIGRLNAFLPASSRLRVEAIARFFQILGEKPVEEPQLADRFAQIAKEQIQLIEEVRRLRSDDPEVQALREDAAKAMQVADHNTARVKLSAAREIVRNKRQVLAGLPAKQQREEAALVAERGQLERTRLNYAEAAKLFAEAEALLSADDVETRWTYLVAAGNSWHDQATQFVEKTAFTKAVESFRSALRYVTRDHLPQQWAMTQNNLGSALVDLGEQEKDIRKLEQARSAVNAAHELFMKAGQEQYRAFFEGRLREIEEKSLI